MRLAIFLFLAFFIAIPPAPAQIDSVLFDAVKRNDFAALQQRLQTGIDINAKDRNGATALMWSVYYCELPVINYLVRHKAMVPEDAMIWVNDSLDCYGSLQGIAARRGKLDVLQYLIDTLHISPIQKGRFIVNRKGEDQTALSIAVRFGRTAVVGYLLGKGAQPCATEENDAEAPLFAAIRYEQWDIFQQLMQTECCREKIGAGVDSILKVAAALKDASISKEARAKSVLQFDLDLRKSFFGEQSPGYAAGLERFAFACNYQGRYDSAEYYQRRILALLEQSGQKMHPHYIRSLNGLAFVCYNEAKYEQAIRLYTAALEIIAKVYPVELYGGCPQKLSEATALSKPLPAVWPSAYTLSLLGVAYEKMGKYDLALRCHNQALTIAKEVTGIQQERYAWVADNTAVTYSCIGMHQAALSLYLTRSAIQELNSNDDGNVGNLIDIGYAYNQLGRYREALPCFERSQKITRKLFGEKHQYYAMSIDGQAYVYEHIGQYDKAAALYSQAFTIYKEAFGESHPYCGFALNNLANLYKTTGNTAEAFTCYQRAIIIRKKTLTEDHPDYAQSLMNLGALYEQTGNTDSAFYLYNEALRLTKKNLGEEHQYYANCLASLASLYLHNKQSDTALQLYQRAYTVNKKIMGEEHPDNISFLTQMGRAEKCLAKEEAATLHFIEAARLQLKNLQGNYSTLSEGEKIAFLTKEAARFNYLPSMAYTQSNPSSLLLRQIYQNELSLKGMVLEEQESILTSIRSGGNAKAFQLYEEWRFNKALLGKQLLLPLSQRVSYFDSLQEATNGLEQQLSRLSSTFYNQRQNRNMTIANIARKLLPREAAVEFIRFQLYTTKWTDSILYAALVLRAGDSIPHFVPLCEEKQLSALLNASVKTDASFAIQKLYAGEKSCKQDLLYHLTWKPLEKYLAGNRTVYFAPAGLLHRIAFNALSDDASQLLVRKYSLQSVLSTRTVALRRAANSKPVTASLWGNIQYTVSHTAGVSLCSTTPLAQTGGTGSSFDFYASDTRNLRGGEWKTLSQTKKEITALRLIFKNKNIPASVTVGTAATEGTFKAFDRRSPQVIHLATHGFFLPVAVNKTMGDKAANSFTVQQNPMFRSGLVLAGGNSAWKGEPVQGKEDGILTAYEIAQLDLSNTDLIVLSACETALGDLQGNEGVIGLQRALKLAGVKQMMVSLWRVPDKETVELMTLFYRNWLSGQSTREALRKAQLKMKEKYPPFFWAAFVLIE